MEEFIRRAQLNTQNKIETCGILAGKKRGESYVITTLIIPKQEGKQDMCHMTDEIELFQTQIDLNVETLGWIHTHPQFNLFLSSVDLHNQLGYQLQLKEAIAIVYSPIEQALFKAFRVKDSRMTEIMKCKVEKFHEHKDTMGAYAWEECRHVVYKRKSELGFDIKIVEMRGKWFI